MRYFLFGGETYYAKGGFNDFVLSSNDLLKLITHAKKEQLKLLDWWHVFDFETNKIIAGTKDQGFGAGELPLNVELF